MTGNQVKGRSFRGALRYNLEKVAKDKAEVLDHSFVKVSENTIMREVQMVRMLRPDLKKYFYHTSINFPPGENMSNEAMKQIGLDYLAANGFNQHQYIMFRHYDADHPHLHILVNRIGYDGLVVSDSNDYARSERVLRELEKKYNLTQVISSHQAKERAITKNELEMMKRTNTPSEKMAMQTILKGVLESKSKLTTNEFISKLRAKGVDVLFNQASTGFVSGISYGYKGVIVKGGKLGNDFKWSAIKNKIDYEQERDRTTIYEANVRSKSTLDKLRAGNEHDQGNTANTQGGVVKYGQLPDSGKSHGLFIFSPSFTATIFKHAARQSAHETERVVNAVFEIPKVLSLATLLDSRNGGGDLGPSNQSPADDAMKRKRRKKKRRGLRM
jgi:hypothetical protein